MYPVVNYDRMRRIKASVADPPSVYFNKPTKFCILLIFILACILYRRWKEKQYRISQKVEY